MEDDRKYPCRYTYEELTAAVEKKGPGNIGCTRDFSVIMLMVDDELIFEVRSDTIKRQPGEICFPGGMKEPGETDIECALRETSEELGIDRDDISIGAKVGTLATYSGNAINVYLGRIDRETFKNMEPAVIEVKEVFTVPLGFFIENDPEVYYSRIYSHPDDAFPVKKVGYPEGYPWSVGRGEIPIYEYEGYIIWGITGRIIKYFTESIKGE